MSHTIRGRLVAIGQHARSWPSRRGHAQSLTSAGASGGLCTAKQLALEKTNHCPLQCFVLHMHARRAQHSLGYCRHATVAALRSTQKAMRCVSASPGSKFHMPRIRSPAQRAAVAAL